MALRASISSALTSSSNVGYLYMFLLALQFASQPILTKKYAPKTIVRSTYVLAQEIVRLVMAILLLLSTGSWQIATAGWNSRLCLTTVGIPAVLYILQNKFSLTAYQHLSPITYNVLNQTKTLSAAICCFLLLGQPQSKAQIGALALLFLSVLVMESNIPWIGTTGNDEAVAIKDEKTAAGQLQRREYFVLGVVPVLLASAISGLAGALSQQTMQTRNSLLFQVELAGISIVFLAVDLLFRPKTNNSTQFWTDGWKLSTWIPVVTNAIGGILVGLVTKHAGAVRKGFALMLGMFLSGALQNQLEQQQKRVSVQQWMGGFLAGASLWIHSQFPVQ